MTPEEVRIRLAQLAEKQKPQEPPRTTALGTLLTWICLIGGAVIIMIIGEGLVALGILHQ